jgi:hypothetical protein
MGVVFHATQYLRSLLQNIHPRKEMNNIATEYPPKKRNEYHHRRKQKNNITTEYPSKKRNE